MKRFLVLGLVCVACGENSEPKSNVSPPEAEVQLDQDTSNTVPALTRPQSDIRGLRWGMSKSEVKAVETGTVKRERTRVLVYEEEIAEEKIEITLGFDSNGRLISVMYNFEERFGNEISPEENIVMMLNDVYGVPDYEQTATVYDPELSRIHTTSERIWYRERTIVNHRRAGGIIPYSHLLIYQERESSFHEILQREASAGKF